MPYKSERMKLSREQDRRIKLSEQQKGKIRVEYASGLISQRKLAEKYAVSKRTIQFVLDPEKEKRAREQFKERRKDGRYKPSKEEWAETMKEHRRYKQALYLKGELVEGDMRKWEKY